MDVVNLQTGKGAADVWTSVWTAKLLVNGQAKDVVQLVKKVAKIGVKIDVKILVKEIASLLVRGLAKLLHRKIELRTAQEELMFQTQ